MLLAWAHQQQAMGPLSIFGASLKVWFDNQDLSTMWQDTAATTPAVVGERVAKQFCKANPAFYRQQATLGQRPYLRQNATTGAYYLECDGSDDGMVTPSLSLAGINKVAIFTAIRKLSDASSGCIAEFSPIVSSNWGSFLLIAPFPSGTSNYSFYASGSIMKNASYTDATVAAPATNVLTGTCDISGDTITLRVNGNQVAQTISDLGSGNFGNYPLYYFRRNAASLPFNGWDFGTMIVAGITPTDAQNAWAENYFNNLAHAY